MVSSPFLQHNKANSSDLLVILESMETSNRKCASTPYFGLTHFKKWQRAKACAKAVNMRYIIHLVGKTACR